MSKETLNQIIRYGAAGVVNTCIGLVIVYLLKDHVGIRLANLFNFAIGMVINFFTTKKFTFKSKGDTKQQGSYFFVIFLFCFCMSYGTLNLLLWEKSIIGSVSNFSRQIFPEFIISLIQAKRYLSITSPEMIATYFGIVVFAAFNFTLNKYITFKKQKEKEPENVSMTS